MILVDVKVFLFVCLFFLCFFCFFFICWLLPFTCFLYIYVFVCTVWLIGQSWPFSVNKNYYYYWITTCQAYLMGQSIRIKKILQWRHNGRDGVSNHQPHDCFLNRLFRRRSKKTSNLSVTGLCEGNSPVTGGLPKQKASDVENVSMWWRNHKISSWKESRKQRNTHIELSKKADGYVICSICFMNYDAYYYFAQHKPGLLICYQMAPRWYA